MGILNLWASLALLALLAVGAICLMNAWRLRHVRSVMWLARFNKNGPLDPMQWLYAVFLGLTVGTSAYAHSNAALEMLPPPEQHFDHVLGWLAAALLILALLAGLLLALIGPGNEPGDVP